jgi:Chaperone of endosialidase
LGYLAGQNITGNYNIAIGNDGVAGENGTVRIGDSQTATYIAGISGTAVVGDTVVVDANGQLGTVASAARFKKEIRPMDARSEAILALKPVTFQYKSDSKKKTQFGLIAEEVAKINPDLVVRDRNGEIYRVRYDAVNAMLLNEFLKEHRKTEKLEATVVRQQKQIDALTAGLQKVSVQLEVSKAAPQTVKNND